MEAPLSTLLSTRCIGHAPQLGLIFVHPTGVSRIMV